jgi:hypothetical protein
MSGTLSENALMLVGVLPSQKDYEIARLLGWYRIPMRMAPKIVDVDYLAFYQTSAFGAAHRWQIEAYAEVKGHELTTRKELLRDEPDHPRANEEYYKLQLGPLQRCDRPILAGKWKRITFFYTLGRLFNQAETISELIVHSEERELLWQSLREKAQGAQRYGNKADNETEALDPMLLSFLQAFQQTDFPEEDYSEI